MTTIGIIGLGSFGLRVLYQLAELDVSVIVLDKDHDKVEKVKTLSKDAYITDAINEETLRRVIPEDIDAVVVDLGDEMEASILVTNKLHKMGIKTIVVKATSDDHGEILRIVGATHVIFPDLDAAINITPLLTTAAMLSHNQLSKTFALAEVMVIKNLEEKNLAECGLRQKFNLNLIAVRMNSEEEYQLVSGTGLVLKEGMHLLVAGDNNAINSYVSIAESEQKTIAHRKEPRKTLFKRLISRG